MSSDSAAGASESKVYKAIHIMSIKNVGSLFAQKKEKYSASFTSPDDPYPACFMMQISFNENRCTVKVYPSSKTVKTKFIKFTIYDYKMGILVEQSANNERMLKRDIGLHFSWTTHGNVGDVEWRVMCEIEYEDPPEAESPPTSSLQTSNLLTFSKNILTLMNDTTDADVTLLVGSEKIKAHKNILMARSTYFQSLFSSGMSESVSNEIKVDEDPRVFKEVLKFMYSGLTPENLDDIAIELLPLADKYLLDELKQLCDLAIRRNLSVDNIAEVLRIADDHDCSDLFIYCVPFFKANALILEQSGWDRLFSKGLFKKLVKACSL